MPRLTKNEDVCITCHRCETICAWVHHVVFNPDKGRVIVDLDYPDAHHLRICIQCGRCHVVCEDTSHQAISFDVRDGKRVFTVKEEECVGCNLCVSVCPVNECITLRDLKPGEIDKRTGQPVSSEYANWTTHPNNPMRTA